MSIESVRRRVAAATSWPWAESPGGIYGVVVSPGLTNGNRAIDAAYGGRVVGESMTVADADLIAHAPTDLALLLAVAEVMKAQDHQECSGSNLECRMCYLPRSNASWTHCRCGEWWPCPSKLALNALDAAE